MHEPDSESFFCLAESVGGIVFVTDYSGRMVWANRQLEDQTGFTIADFQFPQPDNPFIHPADQERVGQFIAAFAGSDAQRSAPIENRFYDRWGRVLYYQSVLTKVSWQNEQALLFVTEAAAAEGDEARLQSEARYRLLVESANDAILRVDASDRIAYANAHARKMLKYNEVELGKRQFSELIAPADRERVATQLGGLVGGQGQRFEAQFVARDGTVRDGDVSATRIRNGRDDGELQAIIRDVTDQKRLERERRAIEARVQQSQRLESIGLLASGVAHDFNNLLTIMLGGAEIALSEVGTEGTLREALGEIREACDRGRELTRQLLAVSGRQMLRKETLNLTEIVQNALSLLRRVIPESIAIETELAPEPIWVAGDRGRIEQVLVNLMVNAKDAMPDGGALRLRTRVADEEHALLEVADTGEGIDESIAERIFEPFFTTKPEGRGTGLGLATAYGVVKQHGGDIRVRSRTEEGTTVEVWLPRSNETPKAVEPQEALPVSAGQGETILVVEDDDRVRAVAEKILGTSGYKVLSAAHPDVAVALFGQQPTGAIQLLLTDAIMPGMSGLDLYRQLVALQPSLKVVMVSGYADHNVLGPVTEEGMPFVEKPYRASHLLATVRAVLASEKSGNSR